MRHKPREGGGEGRRGEARDAYGVGARIDGVGETAELHADDKQDLHSPV